MAKIKRMDNRYRTYWNHYKNRLLNKTEESLGIKFPKEYCDTHGFATVNKKYASLEIHVPAIQKYPEYTKKVVELLEQDKHVIRIAIDNSWYDPNSRFQDIKSTRIRIRMPVDYYQRCVHKYQSLIVHRRDAVIINDTIRINLRDLRKIVIEIKTE